MVRTLVRLPARVGAAGRITLALAIAASVLVPATPAHAGKRWRGSPPLISGTSRFDRGEWIYNDFVYDDYGADTGASGQPNVVSLAPTVGDARYPDGEAFRNNAADIVEIRAKARGNDLRVRVLLQTLRDASTPAIWVKAGRITRVFTNKNAVVNVAANTVSFVLRRVVRGKTVTLNIGAGLNDGTGKLRAGVPGNKQSAPDELTTGGPTDNRLLDLAFNTRKLEPRGGAWNETAQAAALASGDLEPFARKIAVRALRSMKTTPVPRPKGYSVRLFRSRQKLGGGMGPEFPQYRGRWQPYATWVPESYSTSSATPLFLNMHSLSVHHNQYRGGTNTTYRTFYEQFGEGLGAIVVTPLARGPDGWYQDQGLVDTLEVWADALRHYKVDRDRVLVGGYSMGGYGTYRLTTMMPDAFASAVSIVGPPGNGIWAYPGPPPGGEESPDWTYPQLENTLHIPFWITHGMEDELVPFAGVQAQADRLAELGHEHRFAAHPAADHLSFSAQDEWSREVAWFKGHPVRVKNPAEVAFKLRPASWATKGKRKATILRQLQALTRQVGAHLEGAYWVKHAKVAGEGDMTGFVQLTSHGISRRRGETIPITSAGTDGPSPYRLTGIDVRYEQGPRADKITGRLTMVSAITIDVGRAGLSDSPKLEIEADREVNVAFVRNGRVVGRTTISKS